MKQPKEVIQHWIDTTLAEGFGLTKWERSFLESLSEQFERSGIVSDKQQEILESIYAEKTP
jgi:hypothetical protein